MEGVGRKGGIDEGRDGGIDGREGGRGEVLLLVFLWLANSC